MTQFTSSCAAPGTLRLFLLHSIPMPVVLRSKDKNKQKYSEERSRVFLNSLFWVRIFPSDSCLTYAMCLRDVTSEIIDKVCYLPHLDPPSVTSPAIHSLVWVTRATSSYHLTVPQFSPEETNILKKNPDIQTVHWGTFHPPVKEMSHGGNRAEHITKHNQTKQSEDIRNVSLGLLTHPKGHIC